MTAACSSSISHKRMKNQVSTRIFCCHSILWVHRLPRIPAEANLSSRYYVQPFPAHFLLLSKSNLTIGIAMTNIPITIINTRGLISITSFRACFLKNNWCTYDLSTLHQGIQSQTLLTTRFNHPQKMFK
jgi:hypothetical protein